MNKTLEERILAIENSNSLTELGSDILPTSHQEDYYFVSYSHKDYKAVLTDILKLEAEGLNFWYDTDIHIGENWEYIAKTYISKFQCKGVIFYLSKNSILSPACNKEIEYVRKKGLNYFSINLPLSNDNIVSGEEMLSALIANGKVDESKISVEKSKILFAHSFNQDIIYLPYSAPTRAKYDSIVKSLQGRNLFEYKFKLENVDHTPNVPVAVLSACKDNAITEAKIPSHISRDKLVNLCELEEYECKTGKFYTELPLTHIDDTAVFTNFYSLESVELPDTLVSLGADTFRNCYSLEKINAGTLPHLFTIHARAFSSCPNLTALNIPNTVFYLGDGAFENCVNLTEISGGKSLRHIGNDAFKNCSKLSSFTFGEKISDIGSSAFSGCKALINLELPKNLIEIGDNAFANCKSLEKVTMQDSMVEIGYNTFENCAKLREVTLSKYIQQIPHAMFSGCVSLKNITIPNSVEVMLDKAFADCVELQEITLPDSLNTMFDRVFIGCNSLLKAYIPKSVTSYRASFGGCKMLTEIIVDDENPEYRSLDGNVYSVNNEFVEYAVGKLDSTFTLPDNVTEIGSGAFEGASNLKEIVIPNSVQKIGLWPFRDCTSLERIINHSNLKLDKKSLELDEKVEIIN